jgi:hypothetical protein
MRVISLAAALWMAAAASAQDARLNALHATLVTLRSHAKEASAVDLGARPELTVAKHQLRDWIESQLASLKEDGDEKAFAVRINQSLKAVSVRDKPESQNMLGSLGEVRIGRREELLIVTTAVGIPNCSDDESAYGYRSVNDRWQRVWESEQNDYSPNKYTPQHIIAVQVARSFLGGPAFVMTLGYEQWCSSAWHPVYYRVWRVEPSGGSKLLIDGSEIAYMPATYSVGSISGEEAGGDGHIDVLIQCAKRSIDATAVVRDTIQHLLIDGDKVRRVDPVALKPRYFVDEWLTRDWSESTNWSASPTLRQWHKRLHAGFIAGIFGYPTMHCVTPDLWQVGVDLSDAASPIAPQPNAYFLVRWRPPYHFTMLDISDKPWPRCTQEDREADEGRTLFNIQERPW